MRWLLVLVGLALTAIGGGVTYATLAPSGAERTFVIALAACLAVSAGVSLLVLGLALGHVDRLAADLRARVASLQAGLSSSAADDTFAAPRPSLAKPPSAWAAPAFPASVSDAEDGEPAPLPPEFLRRGDARGEPAAKPVAATQAPQPPHEPLADALVMSILEETGGAAPAAVPPLVHAVDWERETAAAAPEDRMPAAASLSQPAAPLPEPAPERAAAAAAALPAPAPAAPAPASPPLPDPPPRAPVSAPEPAVIGRYNAGGAAYIMFSDGTIEAETAGGTFRFSSMNELREFIEARSQSSADADA